MSFENEMMGRARNYTTAAAEVAQIKSGPGRLLALEVQNVNAATRFLWLFDNTASSGTVLIAPIRCPTGDGVRIVFPVPRAFSVGLRWNASDTVAFNSSGGADLIVTAQYI